MAIAEAADEAGVLLLIRNYARQEKPFPGVLHTAIRHVAVGERPSDDWVGATVRFSLDVSGLRKELFNMISSEKRRSKPGQGVPESPSTKFETSMGRRSPNRVTRTSNQGQPWPIV